MTHIYQYRRYSLLLDHRVMFLRQLRVTQTKKMIIHWEVANPPFTFIENSWTCGLMDLNKDPRNAQLPYAKHIRVTNTLYSWRSKRCLLKPTLSQ